MIKALKEPVLYFIWMFGRILPKNQFFDGIYLKILYRYKMGKRLNLDSPKTFNEKLQWIKLYDRKPIYTTMVDKYEVKKYVSDIIGEEYIIPTLGVWDKFEEIDFERLPNQFVLKCTHDSGGLIIVKDKGNFDINKAKKKINHCMRRNYYINTREWPYKNVKHRIIAEPYLEDSHDESMHDYKFFCFNGEAKYVLVCTNRETSLKETFFDTRWNKAPFKREKHDEDAGIKKPINLDTMIKFANKLSEKHSFIRVDFYEIDGKVFFGELTFFPSGGMAGFSPDKWDLNLGELIKLPDEEKK